MKKLSEEQKIFAEMNHDLVYSFLNKKQLKYNEFYDVVVFGFLRAVKNYLEKENLHNYKFSTIAWKAMNSELKNYYRMKKVKTSNTLMLLENKNYKVPYSFAKELGDVLDDLEFRTFMTKDQFNVCKMKEHGKTHNEIAKEKDLSLSTVKRYIKKIKKLLS